MTHYIRLVGMAVLSFISMYVLMYAMVNRFVDVYPNNNQLYMAALMTAPMIIFELFLMGGMYQNRSANMAIVIASIVLLGAAWFAIRTQSGIGDRQFLRSMIPHHSGAILMCEQSIIQDPEIVTLCKTILDRSSRRSIKCGRSSI
jgi:Domain of unknown function (DUF305)